MIIGVDVQYSLDIMLRVRHPTGKGVRIFHKEEGWKPITSIHMCAANLAPVVCACYMVVAQGKSSGFINKLKFMLTDVNSESSSFYSQSELEIVLKDKSPRMLAYSAETKEKTNTMKTAFEKGQKPLELKLPLVAAVARNATQKGIIEMCERADKLLRFEKAKIQALCLNNIDVFSVGDELHKGYQLDYFQH